MNEENHSCFYVIALYPSDIRICDFWQCKANGTGVDLNRNFDAGWIEYDGSIRPSSEIIRADFLVVNQNQQL